MYLQERKSERERKKDSMRPNRSYFKKTKGLLFPLCLFYTSALEIAPILCPEDIFKIEAPQFQIGAAAKTGSTSLYSYVCQHPSIECLAKKKETNLLRTPRKIKIPNEKEKFKLWYQQEGFKERESCNQSASYITFEASVHYYHHKTALENLRSLLPCSKIVWVLWNPLPRAVSEYLHQAVKSRSYPTFSGLLKSELNAIKTCGNSKIVLSEGFENKLFKCISKARLKKYLLSTAFYGYFISSWLSKFPSEKDLFLDYEEFKRSPQLTVGKIAKFLGLKDFTSLQPVWQYNKANTRDGRDGRAKVLRERIQLSHSLKRSVKNTLKPHIEEMYGLIEQNFHWNLDNLL